MAYRRNNPGDPHLQVGSRLARTLLAALLVSVLAAAPSLGATTKPTPKPTATVKASATATAKPTTKASATASAKATTKASATATAKASTTAKPTATKKSTPKKKSTKKKVRVSPSPKPVWPPKGFVAEGDVYAKIPTSKELVGIISANKSLALQIKECEQFICGAVQVAAEPGCIWWEVVSDIYGGDNAKLGTLNTAHGPSKAREIKTIISIAPETALTGGRAKVTSVLCHQEALDADAPRVTYKKVETTP